MSYKWMHLKREFNHLIVDDRSGTVLTRCGQLLARTDFQGEMAEPYCLSCKNRQDRDAIKRAKKLEAKEAKEEIKERTKNRRKRTEEPDPFIDIFGFGA